MDNRSRLAKEGFVSSGLSLRKITLNQLKEFGIYPKHKKFFYQKGFDDWDLFYMINDTECQSAISGKINTIDPENIYIKG